MRSVKKLDLNFISNFFHNFECRSGPVNKSSGSSTKMLATYASSLQHMDSPLKFHPASLLTINTIPSKMLIPSHVHSKRVHHATQVSGLHGKFLIFNV